MQQTWWPETGTIIVTGPYCGAYCEKDNIRLIRWDHHDAYITSRTLAAFICDKSRTAYIFRCRFRNGSLSDACLESIFSDGGKEIQLMSEVRPKNPNDTPSCLSMINVFLTPQMCISRILSLPIFIPYIKNTIRTRVTNCLSAHERVILVLKH